MKKKLLDDPRVIAGLFKEAMFYSRPLQVDGIGFSENAIITDFQESSGRSRDTNRTLFLTFTADVSDSDRRGTSFEAKLQCHFVHFSGMCTVSLQRCEDGQYRAEMPTSLEIFNRRAQKRITPIGSEKIFLPLVIQNAGLHTEGLFTLENTSLHGFGGILKVMASVPISIGSLAHGKWVTPKGSLSISGKILRVELLEKGNASAESVYRIGIQQYLTEDLASIAEVNENKPDSERRSSKRVSPQLNIQVRSPVNPSHAIQMKVHDASVSGFSARLIDMADSHLLPVGCGVAFEDRSLIAELVGISDTLLRFQFTHGSTADRLFWLKKLANFQNAGTFTSSGIGSELMELFCESGASAAGFLKMQSPFAQAFDDGLASKINEGEWMHRWIERTETGEVRGHMSAVQIADNLWHIGDLAGMIQTESKISKAFFPKFFISFQEFCLSTSPCPSVLFGYLKEHPFWLDLDTYLRSQIGANRPTLIQSKYHRFSIGSPASLNNKSEMIISSILARDHSSITSILEKCEIDESRFFLRALDFSIETFASPKLSRLINSSMHSLRRNYYTVDFYGAKFVFIIQSFPIGSSQNRTTDVGWLLPINKIELTDAEKEKINSAIFDLVRRNGYTSPGYIELIDASTNPTKNATKNMTWTICHPQYLGFFEGKL